MSSLFHIIKRPVLTEKSSAVSETKAVFKVAVDATKPEIRQAVEKLFGVKVKAVNTTVMPGKPKRFGRNTGRRSAWKKAVVTMANGQQIEIKPEDTAVEAGGVSE